MQGAPNLRINTGVEGEIRTGTTPGKLSNWCVRVSSIRRRRRCRSEGQKDVVPGVYWITQDNRTRHRGLCNEGRKPVAM